MANKETTNKINIDISQLKKGIQDARRQISLANSEFKAISSSMEDWQHSTEGLEAKLNQLRSTLTAQKTILSNLEEQYRAVVEEQGEGSAGAERLKIAINNQRTAINKTEKEINQYSQSLDEVNTESNDTVKSSKKAANAVDDLGDSARDAESGFTILKGAIATFAGNALTAFVGGIKDAISSLAGLAEETREYRTDMAKLKTAFTSAGFTTEQATKTYKDFYAILGDEGQATEAVNHLAKLTNNQKDLATWTGIATGVYATFGNSLPIEGLTESANETAKVGQVTGSLADALNWAGVSEDKFNEKLEACTNEQERQALIRDTLNGLYSDSAKEYEKNNKSVMEANRANSDYTDTLAAMAEKIEPVTTAVKKGFTELLNKALELVENVDMSAFSDKVEEAFATLKDDVLPAITDGFQWIIDNKDIIIAGLAGIASGFVAFNVASTIMSVVNAFKAFKTAQEGATVAQWLLNTAMNANPIMLIVTLLTALVGGIATFIATNEEARAKFTEIWNTIKDTFWTVVNAVCKFFTETIPEAFNSFVTSAGEFVTNTANAISELPGKFSEWLTKTTTKIENWISNIAKKATNAGSKFVGNITDKVKSLPGKFATWLSNVIAKVTTWVSNLGKKATTAGTKFITNVVDKVKELPSKMWTHLTSAVSKAGEFANNLKDKAVDAGKKMLNGVIDNVKNLPSKITSIGKNIVTGMWEGITGKFDWLTDKIKGFASNVTDKLKGFFGIHSPSRVMRDEVGKYLSLGIAEGITQNKDAVEKAMNELVSGVSNGVDFKVSNVKGRISNTGHANGVDGGKSSTSNTYTFYQYNNSPKALSRLEIYRQTKNQLNFAKGV